MHMNSMCIPCILSKEEQQIRSYTDEEAKSAYLHRVLELLYRRGLADSAPCLVEQINETYREFWGREVDYGPQKQVYNRLLLELEPKIEEQIRRSSDSMRECIKYVCAANYIDFSAVADVNQHTLEELMGQAAREQVDEGEYEAFLKDLKQAKTLAYLTDNCGEIVLDKVFIKHIRERFPHIGITAIVRGKPVINDATLEDAEEVGLTELVSCIGSGSGAPGTVVGLLGEEARQVLLGADLVISKGQGNFEGLYGEGLNPYYLFLCKCELFVRRFGLKQFSSVFRKEERIHGCL